jgi:nitrogenase molybdenum-iron protein alpha chain
MGLNLNVPAVQVREERLGSVSRFNGKASDIPAAFNGGIPRREKCRFSQNSGCMNGCAQGYLGAIDDAAIVTHAPIGCAADFMGSNNARKWGEFAQGRPHVEQSLYCTNMNERDTVFGAIEKLRETVLDAYRTKHPKAIFVSNACVSAITGEDIETLSAERTESLGIPVVAVPCEGCKTKIWASGFDAAFHALLTGVCKASTERSNYINVINFRGSATAELNELFEYLGFKPRLVAGFQTIEELSKMSDAAATVSICGTLGSYLGNGLEQQYGVPYVKALQPHGIVGFEDWLQHLGVALHREDRVAEYIKTRKPLYMPKIEALRKKLEGTRAVVGMGPSFAFNFSRVLEEIGIKVESAFAWHLDFRYDHGVTPESIEHLCAVRGDLPVQVNDLQYNDVIQNLRRINPDIYFYRHPVNAGIIMKLGIPAVSLIDEYMAFGYQGLISFAKIIADVLENRNFERKLAAKTSLPYTAQWLNSPTREG